MKKLTVLLIIVNIIFAYCLFAQDFGLSSDDEKVIAIPEGQSRSFMFTNQFGIFYYGETGLPNTSKFHGLNYLTHEILDDYIIEIAGTELLRQKSEVHLYPDKLIRNYNKLAVNEEVAIADSLPVLTIKINSTQKAPLSITPLISKFNHKFNYVSNWEPSDKILYIAQKHNLVKNSEENYPVWIGICTYPEGNFLITENELLLPQTKINDKNFYIPGKINVYLENSAYIFFIIGESKRDVLKNRNRILKKLKLQIKKPKIQINGIRQV